MTLISDTIFAVIDTETTGSYPTKNRIMDISCILVKDESIIYTYNSLINPHQHIPEFIQNMTGITDNMTINAPDEYPVLQDVYDILSQKSVCFAAHNCNFDWSFVNESFKREHFNNLDIPKLCTLKLAKKIVSKNIKKNVGDLANYYNIPIINRHRAFGDAYATALFFIEFLHILKDRYDIIYLEDLINFQNLKKYAKVKRLNLQLREKLNGYLNILPQSFGIIKFIDDNKKIIHIAKANNIKDIFSSYIEPSEFTSPKTINILNEFNRIEWTEADSELETNLLFYDELKNYLPKYNYIPSLSKINNFEQEFFSGIVLLSNSAQEKTIDVFFIYRSRFIKHITIGIKADLTEVFELIADIYYENKYIELAEDNKKDYFKIKIVNDWLKKYYQAASIIKFSYQSKKTFEDDIDNKIKNFYNNTNQTESFFDFEHDA